MRPFDQSKRQRDTSAHPECLSLGEVHLPLVFRLVVHQKTRVQHKVPVLERLVQGALFHEHTPLARFRQLERKRASLRHLLVQKVAVVREVFFTLQPLLSCEHFYKPTIIATTMQFMCACAFQ